MGRESRRDAEDGGRRHRRAPPRHSETATPPEPRMRAQESPSLSRSLPHRGKLQQHRSDEVALRATGNGDATTSASSSSQAATDHTMPPLAPPPPPLRLARSQTVAYSRRHRDPVVYEDDRLALTPLRRSRTDISPGHHGRRPRLVQEFLSTPSSTTDASTDSDNDDHSDEGQEEEEEDDDDEDEDEDDDDEDSVDHSSSNDELQEEEDELALQGRNLIEVVEEADDEASRERRPKHAQRNGHLGHPGYPEEKKHHRARQVRGSPSPNELRTRRRHHHSVDNHKSPARRSSLTQSDIDRSPPTGRRRKVASLVEVPRPPVTAHRSSKHGRKPTDVIHHETPPRRSTTVASGRSSTRSSSRRPASILGSLFGGPPPMRTSPEKPPKLVECVVCMGEMPSPKAPKLKCGHHMCHSCLQRSFRLSITDPQHMPPKCCTQDYIPLKHVERLFDNSFKRTWNRKFAEFSTRNRIYCPARKCGEWIKPANIRRHDGRKIARCGRCKTKVCGACNGKWHSSAECPRDEETNKFLQQAQEEGWQRCFGCKVMVELKEGCNHMTCRCGAEFCMICGTKWKNCDCPWFNYDTIDTDRLGHMNVPEPTMRPDVRDIFAGDGSPVALELRGRTELAPVPPPPRPGTYEEEMLMRRIQEQRDADLARRMQLYGESDEEYDDRGGIPDMLGTGSSSGHHTNEDYRRARRRMAAPSPPPAAPTMFEQRPDYVTDVNRARGMRSTSLERRLADRFSENRYGMGPRPGMGSPVSPHGFSPMHPPPPPVGIPTMAMPMPMPMAMAMAPPPPPMPVLPQHPLRPDMYHGAHSAPPEHLMGGARSPHFYGNEFEAHAPRSRRPGRDELEAPKSSTLAGLTGPGSGMNRVYEWRNFVEPGIPEDERIAGRA